MVRVYVESSYSQVRFSPQVPEYVAALAINSNVPKGQIEIIRIIDNRIDNTFFILYSPYIYGRFVNRPYDKTVLTVRVGNNLCVVPRNKVIAC